MKKYTKKELIEFINESNYIEREYNEEALEDSLEAWKYIKKLNKIDLNSVLETHRILMNRLNNRIAGKMRNCNVRVGYNICPDYTLVNGLLNEWLRLHSNAKTEEKIKLAHVVFESIHPFEDGNGRTGRLILNWQRIKNNLPLLIIHTGEEQYEYYKWFK